jgi:ribosomal protein S18 acetylase RimI-like enzyme
MFTEEKDPHYNKVKWITPDGHNLYIHRLAVHPKNQKQGIARQMMDFAENFGKKKGMESIRLDTFSQNPRNIKFYRKRGYKKLGDVYFSKQSKDPFHCFEKLIKRI